MNRQGKKGDIFAALPTSSAVISFTETWAMSPPSAVSGFYLAHPGSRYFSIPRWMLVKGRHP